MSSMDYIRKMSAFSSGYRLYGQMASRRTPQPDFPSDPDLRYLTAFIAILREDRLRRGLGERELTRTAGVGNGAIGRAEKMDRIPSVIVFRRWVRALGLDWVEVCREAEEASRES